MAICMAPFCAVPVWCLPSVWTKTTKYDWRNLRNIKKIQEFIGTVSLGNVTNQLISPNHSIPCYSRHFVYKRRVRLYHSGAKSRTYRFTKTRALSDGPNSNAWIMLVYPMITTIISFQRSLLSFNSEKSIIQHCTNTVELFACSLASHVHQKRNWSF